MTPSSTLSLLSVLPALPLQALAHHLLCPAIDGPDLISPTPTCVDRADAQSRISGRSRIRELKLGPAAESVNLARRGLYTLCCV